MEIVHRSRHGVQPAFGVARLADAPEPGCRLLQPLVPGEQDVERRTRRARVTEAVQQEKKAAEVDDVVALLPGIAQVALGEPGLEPQRVQKGAEEIEIRDTARIEHLDRPERVVRQVKADILPTRRRIGLLEHVIGPHSRNAKQAVGVAIRLEPGHQGSDVEIARIVQQRAAQQAVIGAGQQHPRPARLIVCGADPQHAGKRALGLHRAQPGERARARRGDTAVQRGILRVLADHPFTAPAARPCMTWRCASRNSSATGRVMTTDSAMMPCRLVPSSPLRLSSATGSV